MTKLSALLAAAGLLLGSLALATPASALASGPVTTAKKYSNCAALNRVYPHGVGKPGAVDKAAVPVTNFTVSKALYLANKGRDRDRDGIACEKR